MRIVIALFAACVVALTSCPGRGVEIEVVAQGEKLVSQPSPSAESVLPVAKGDRLTALEQGESWVRVEAPPGVHYWVYGELVRDGVVAVTKLGIRSGPGIDFPSIGSLKSGDVVEVLGTEGEWVRIAPPPGSGLWIRRAAVREHGGAPAAIPTAGPLPEPAPAAVVTPLPKPLPAVAPVVVSSPSPARRPVERKAAARPPTAAPPPSRQPSARPSSPPAAPVREPVQVAPAEPAPPSSPPGVLSGERLVRGRDQGVPVELEGIVTWTAPVWRRPSLYGLVSRDEYGRAVLVCYILGRPSKLRPLLGSSVTLSGMEYWVEGVRRPVVAPDRLIVRR